MNQPNNINNKDKYKMNISNDSKGLNSVQQEFQNSFLRHNGWVPLLEKYVHLESGQVTSDIPIDIWQFQEEIVSKFSNFLLSADDIYNYFIGIKSQIISLRDNSMITKALHDLVRELCRPTYYRECVDCSFFQQKCERMKKIIESSYNEIQFRQFLDFLTEKRKQFSEQTSTLKVEKIANLIEKAQSMRKKVETVEKKKTGLKKFFDECKEFVIIDDGNGSSNMNCQNKKNKIIISPDKSSVSVVYQIIQKLQPYESYKILEKIMTYKDNNPVFQFELKGNEISILGEQKGQKQKAKESCCDNVVKMIIQSFEENPESSKSETNTSVNLDEIEEKNEAVYKKSKNCLLFSPDELFIAQPASLDSFKVISEETQTHKEGTDFNHHLQKTKPIKQQQTSTPIKIKIDIKPKDMIAEQSTFTTTSKAPIKNTPPTATQTPIKINKEEKDENEFDKIKSNLNKIREDLYDAGKIELNPFTLIKRLFPDPKKSSTEIKRINNLLLQIILSAVKLYEYEEFIQSPCVLVQENSNTFFLKTLIMKKKIKNKSLIGRVRSMNEEYVFICSALELIYKFSFKHQSHNGDIYSLDQVISGLIVQAEYLSSEHNEQLKINAEQKLLFTDKMQPTPSKDSNKNQNNKSFFLKQYNPANIQDQFKLVL